MDKKIIGILVLIAVACFISVVVAFSEFSEPVEENTSEALTEDSTQGNTDIAAEVSEGIDDYRSYSWADIEKVTYDENSKSIVVVFYKLHPANADDFRNAMVYSTFDTMPVVASYSGYLDTVIIEGYTYTMDSQGNEDLTKAYQAKVSMEHVTGVNWENLRNSNNLISAINNNFDSVYWHPVVA